MARRKDGPYNSCGGSAQVLCHITTVHLPFDGRIFHKECVTLANAGYDVHLIQVCDHDDLIDGVHIHALPKPSSRLVRLLGWPWLAYKKAMSLCPRPLIYHFHDPELLPIGILLRLQGFEVIYDIHEDVAGQIRDKYWIPGPLRKLASFAYRVIESLGVLRMGIIESDPIEGQYRQPKQSIRNLPLLKKVKIVPRTQQEFEGKPLFIYAGGVAVPRGAIFMLHLAEALAERGLVDRVILIDRVPLAESLRLMSTSTVGLSLLKPIPNYEYALPTKILEYMTFGLPVISTDLPCSGSYVRQCDAGILVKPENLEEMVDATIRLLGDPDRMLHFSRSGQKAIAEHLNWEKESQMLLRFYQRMLGAPIEPDTFTPHRRRGDKFRSRN